MKLHFFSSWDSKIDDLLLSNKVTLNLLYIQTVSDVELNWVQGTQETEKQLARMQVNF
jgi:sorting nexin-17